MALKQLTEMVLEHDLSEMDVKELADRYDITPKYVVYAMRVAFGDTHKEATQHIGLKEQRNSYVYRSKHPGVDQLINDFSRALLKTINSEAIETLHKLLKHKSGSVQYNAARFIVDKNLGGNEQNINIRTEKDSVDDLLAALKGNKSNDEF